MPPAPPRPPGALPPSVPPPPARRHLPPAACLPPRTFHSYLPRSHRTYSCVHCRAHLARHEELISKVPPPRCGPVPSPPSVPVGSWGGEHPPLGVGGLVPVVPGIHFVGPRGGGHPCVGSWGWQGGRGGAPGGRGGDRGVPAGDWCPHSPSRAAMAVPTSSTPCEYRGHQGCPHGALFAPRGSGDIVGGGRGHPRRAHGSRLCTGLTWAAGRPSSACCSLGSTRWPTSSARAAKPPWAGNT